MSFSSSSYYCSLVLQAFIETNITETQKSQRVSWENHSPFLKLEATLKKPDSRVDKVTCPARNFFLKLPPEFPLKELLGGAQRTVTGVPNPYQVRVGLSSSLNQPPWNLICISSLQQHSYYSVPTARLLLGFLLPSLWKSHDPCWSSSVIFSHLLMHILAILPRNVLCCKLRITPVTGKGPLPDHRVKLRAKVSQLPDPVPWAQ